MTRNNPPPTPPAIPPIRAALSVTEVGAVRTVEGSVTETNKQQCNWLTALINNQRAQNQSGITSPNPLEYWSPAIQNINISSFGGWGMIIMHFMQFHIWGWLTLVLSHLVLPASTPLVGI